MRPEAAVGTQQEPALAGSSRAVAVEIPDDDSSPPGWDEWVNLPMPSPKSQEGVLVRRWDGHMVAGGRGLGVEASSSRAARSAPGEGRVDESPAFADAQEEQQLWGELRDHGAALNRVLNEALRIHGGPAWRVFQVRHRCPFSSTSSSSCLFLAVRCLLVSVCWRQELEDRARVKYGAFDRMSAELGQLREQRDAFDALADALGTQTAGCRTGLRPYATSSRSAKGRSQHAPPPLNGFAQPSSIEMRRCSRRGGIWRGCVLWRPTGRRR
jgi:hypothetical protein